MVNSWYTQDKKELLLEVQKYMNNNSKQSKQKIRINGLIVPHAGYEYSGQIAGKAYSLLKGKKIDKAILLSPSHYMALRGIITHDKEKWRTILGDIVISPSELRKADISQEHAIDNQIPFLQALGFKEILPIIIGKITIEELKHIANQIIPYLKDSILIVSSDLSHFLEYQEAKNKDQETIQAITNLDSDKLVSIDNSACGIFPLLTAIELCKIKKWKPRLLEYKNSGDITSEKSSVVGYASLFF